MNHNETTPIPRRSRAFGNYDFVLENNLLRCRVYWARVVGSETESLLTQYTKHTFYEIQYALEGRIVMQIDKERKITVEQSQFIIIPPDTFHQIVDGDSEGARFIMAFSLEIKTPALVALPTEMARLSVTKAPDRMLRLIELLLEKPDHDDPLRRRLVGGYLECFILETAEALDPVRLCTEAAGESENEMRVRKISRTIADCNGIGIGPEDVGREFGISPRHLNRIFIQITGATLKEAINRQKLARIEELVAATGLSFREISELCGFSDEYAMNKFFKRYNACSLSDYRALRAPKKN